MSRDYQNDPVFIALGGELMDARKDRDHARHLVKHAARSGEELGKQISEHLRQLNTALIKLKADKLTTDNLTSLVIAASASAAWLVTMAKVGECDCTTRVARVAVDEPVVVPTAEQIEALFIEGPRHVCKVLPLPIRKFVVLVKPPRGGGAA